MKIDVEQAKIRLSELIDLAALKEDIVITVGGKPVAKLIAVPPGFRKFGSAKGEFTVPDDFNDPLPEIEDLFYGE